MPDIDKAICAISKVINNSKENVLLVSGMLRHEAYESQKVVDAIKGALSRSVRFDIIVGPDYDKESVFILDTLKDFIWVAPEWPEHHFMVGDNKHVRYEKDHRYSDSLPAVGNMVALDMPDIAEYLSARFYELKPSCKRFTETTKAKA